MLIGGIVLLIFKESSQQDFFFRFFFLALKVLDFRSAGIYYCSFLKKVTRQITCIFFTKLYIPSTINILEKVLTKAIWADKKWASFWQISLYIK